MWAKCFGAVGVLCLLLAIPEGNPRLPSGAGRTPFEWKQDAFWAELEKQFTAARGEPGELLSQRIQEGFAQVQQSLELLNSKALVPEEPTFSALETNLFYLAAWVAATSNRLNEYVAAAAQLRSAVKRQSEHWDISQAGAKRTLYRQLYGTRLAMEELLVHARNTNAISPLFLYHEEPSQTPSLNWMGIKLHSGDLLVSRGGAPTSALIARGNDYPGSFSHVALLHVDEKTGRGSIIEAHIEQGVVPTSFEQYLADKKLKIMVLRLRADLPALTADPLLPHKAAAQSLQAAQARHIAYDFAMDYRDHSAQFCSEVASSAYEPFGMKLWTGMSFISSPTLVAWLGSIGVRHFETQEPADLEYDPQLRIVAEWRDPAMLFKAHIDDAVTDAMLEAAPAGKPLPCNRALLPFSRIAKVYSAVLNRFGAVGPVPEGMTSTAALRVKQYRAQHAAIAARVTSMAEEFHRQQGYAAPYWALLDLARKAQKKTSP